MALNTTATMIPASTATTPSDRQYYDLMLIEANRQLRVHEQFCDPKQLPKRMGKAINFRTKTAFPLITAPLVEGVTPAARSLTITEAAMLVLQYGDVAGVTDMIDLTATDPHLNEIVAEQSEQMELSRDTIIRDSIVPAATNAYNATAAGALGVGGVGTTAALITAYHLDQMILNMKILNAKKWTKVVRPGSGYDSAPIGECWPMVTHPYVATTIRDFADFRDVEQYASGSAAKWLGEIGKYRDLRIIETTNAYVDAGAGAGGVAAYYSTIFAKNCAACVALDGMSSGTYTAPAGSGDDVLEQRHKAGWKMALVAGITKQANIATLTNVI